jgi:diguanylate cyclase (GGDEF)-like protein/PAS domain S-box-containing protein
MSIKRKKQVAAFSSYDAQKAGLALSEEKWQAIFDSLSDAIMILDKDCRIMMANKAAAEFVERLSGHKPDELIGKQFIDTNILKPESREMAMAHLKQILAGDHPEAAVYEFLDKDKKILIGEVSCAPLYQNGEVIAVISVARDVTKRHQTEQELKYINTLLTTQQQTSLDGILVVDEKGRMISYNQRFIEIWGLPLEIVESRSNERALEYVSDNVVNSEAANAVVRHLYEQSNEKSHDEVSLKDGRTLDRYSAPMVSEDGRHYGRVWYFRDITKHKQAEHNILQANQKLLGTVNKLEERNYHNGILSEMREMLQACSSVSEVSSIIRGSMGKLFPNASGALFMMSASRSDLESVIRWEEFPGDVDDNMFAADACWALRRGRVHLVENANIGPLCPHLKHPPKTAYVCLPLVAKGDVLGLLHLRGNQSVSMELQQKTAADLKELAGTITEYLSLSIANIRLGEKLAAQSIRDPLTNLFNRRYMEESLRREILRAERKKTPIGIVMADIDFFKQFNDRYGHAAGDELLARVGEFLNISIRGADVACRYGGEEFILFLPESSIENTYKRMDRIREDLQRLEVHSHGERLASITLSFGIAGYPDQGTDAETLINKADRALYRAKQEGRNRIVVA